MSPIKVLVTGNYYIIAALLFISSSVFGQKIDSLKSLLPGTTGADKVDILYQLCYEHIDVDNEAAKVYGRMAYGLSQQLQDSLRIAKTGRVFGLSLARLGSVDSAIQLYSAVLPIIKKKQLVQDLKKALNSLAVSYSLKGQYDKALSIHFESLNLCEQERDTVAITVALNNIGFVYFKLEDHDKALAYWNRCFDLKRRIGDDFDLDFLLANMGLAHAYKGDRLRAKRYIDQAIKACGEKNCSPRTITSTDFVLGVIHFKSKEFKIAEAYFLKSYLLARQTDNVRFQFDNIDHLTQIYIRQNQIDLANLYLRKAEELINNGTSYSTEMINVYYRFSEMHNMTRNHELSAHYQQKYILLKDSLYSQELTTNLMKLEAQYQEKENKARISSQEQILGLKEKIILQQTASNIILGCISIMLVLVAGMLYHRNSDKRMINKILSKKVEERTIELQKETEALLLAKKNIDESVESTVAEINKSLSVITSLCTSGLKEVSEPVAREYLGRVSLTSEQLSFTLKSLQTPAT